MQRKIIDSPGNFYRRDTGRGRPVVSGDAGAGGGTGSGPGGGGGNGAGTGSGTGGNGDGDGLPGPVYGPTEVTESGETVEASVWDWPAGVDYDAASGIITNNDQYTLALDAYNSLLSASAAFGTMRMDNGFDWIIRMSKPTATELQGLEMLQRLESNIYAYTSRVGDSSSVTHSAQQDRLSDAARFEHEKTLSKAPRYYVVLHMKPH